MPDGDGTDASSWKQNEVAFETKEYSKYYDPCQDAATRSIRCLHRNSGDKELCSDFFQFSNLQQTKVVMDDNDLLGSLLADGELGDLVKAQNWPVVVDVCDKKRKKGDNSDPVQVCRIVALFLSRKSNSKELARRELDTLLSRSRPVTDASALSLLESLAQTYHGDVEITSKLGRIWERASGALPNNEWLLRTWFQSKFRGGLYKEAKQAAMVWMKAYPKCHDPFFLFIVVNFVISKVPHTPETDRKLCQMLAYRALATAAADTVSDGGVATKDSGRILEAQEDLMLLLRVYKDQGKIVEARNILEDARRGFASAVGNRSWELVIQMIELQGLCERWELQWHTCREILQESRPEKFKRVDSGSNLAYGERGDDWRIWDGLVTAANNCFLRNPKSAHLPVYICTTDKVNSVVKETEQLVADFSVPKSRNALLAFLKLHSKGAAADPASKKLFKKCQKYFEDYSAKIACFQDMRPHLSGLSRSHQEMLVANITRQGKDRKPISASKATWVSQIVFDINSLKLDYHLVIARTNHRDHPTLLPTFVATCLRLYGAYLLLDLQLPHGDRGPADDAAILAATGLIMMYHLGNSKALLRSVVLLEYLLSHSKHNYDALLLLVRIYMYLGAGSLAMDRYARLTIKNIQHASISWILFTRLSTIHPWPAKISAGGSVTTTFDPLDEIKRAIDWQQGANKLSDKALNHMINNKQWNMILGLLETQDSLQNGFARAMLTTEYQRIDRVRNVPQQAKRDIPLEVPSNVHDNLDRTAFPNYQPITEPTLDEILPTPSPSASANAHRLTTELSLACLWDELHGKQWSSKESRRLKMLADNSPSVSTQALTVPEMWTQQILSSLWKLLFPAVIQPEDPTEHVLDALGSIQCHALNYILKYVEDQSLCSATEAPKPDLWVPSWYTFHAPFSMLDTIRFVERCVDKVTTHSGIKANGEAYERLEKEIKSIRNVCTGIQENLYRNMIELRGSIAGLEGGYLKALQAFVKGEDELGTEMDHQIAGSITIERRLDTSSGTDPAVRSETAKSARNKAAVAVDEVGTERDGEGRGISIAAPRMMTRFCTAQSLDQEANFHKSKHIKYWLRCLKTLLPSAYTSNDSQRMTFAYFTLSALDLLDALDDHITTEERRA
ncbi:MAG: hypothetical protein Q9163_000924, partial [Psora crenata]